MLIYRPFKISPGIEAEAHKFASEVKREGYESGLLMVSNGRVSFIDLHDEESHFLKLIDQSFCELFEVEPCE